MAERMTDERRQYIESYLTGCAKSSDEPWTIPDMLREALNEVDALRAQLAALKRERDGLREALERVANMNDWGASYVAEKALAAFALRSSEKAPRCDGRYPAPSPRDEPFEVTYRCGRFLGHEGEHGSEEKAP